LKYPIIESKSEIRTVIELLKSVPVSLLVDGEKMIEMFEFLELGLKPKKTYDVDYGFFEEFKS